VVGGLVEQQHVGPREERLRQQHPELVAARERAHRVEVAVGGDAEALEQLGRAGLGGVAVLLRDDALQLGEAHAHLVGHLPAKSCSFSCIAVPEALLPMSTTSRMRWSS
jgi:hypothetical protein